ncbi:MAG: hypothetical protein KF786_07465 [Burkholderiaceae bacterium]|jgi:hypothetical protein|nr:hypothetical protein [Burkholderiaceae bacterium]ODS97552.1 MAG: hypothetical protein ABS56_09020 [Lautropia sp. SCN 69-89]HMN64826.1 hypothetical protein [Burkholderiaceae bacterium]
MDTFAPRPGRRRLLLAAAAALPVGCAGPQFVPPPAGAIPAPRVQVGQRWRYDEINRYNGERRAVVTAEVVQVSPQLRVSLTDADGRRRDDEIYDRPWRVVQEPSYDYTQIFDRPVPLLPEPLAVGGGGFTQVGYRSVLGRDYPLVWNERMVARGWEDLRVPAGQFLALRVERIIQFVHIDFRREESVREETIWYAPAVNRWVQREWTGRYVIPGGDFKPIYREDWVRWQLLDWREAG